MVLAIGKTACASLPARRIKLPGFTVSETPNKKHSNKSRNPFFVRQLQPVFLHVFAFIVLKFDALTLNDALHFVSLLVMSEWPCLHTITAPGDLHQRVRSALWCLAYLQAWPTCRATLVTKTSPKKTCDDLNSRLNLWRHRISKSTEALSDHMWACPNQPTGINMNKP